MDEPEFSGAFEGWIPDRNVAQRLLSEGRARGNRSEQVGVGDKVTITILDEDGNVVEP